MSGESEDRKSIPALSALRAFEAVGRLYGIRRAAEALQVDHAVVSRHLRTLEDWAGVELVTRIAGRTILTDEGMRYHARISAALGEISDASTELLRRNGAQRLSIWCIPGFASQWLASRLAEFQSRHPELEFELHPTDNSPDFSRYEADVDIRYVQGDEPISAVSVSGGVRRFEIARPAVIPVASPGRAALLPAQRGPEDLLRGPLLHEEDSQQWRSWLVAAGVRVEGTLPGPRLWHAHLTIEAARRGQGIALANPFLIGDDFATGRLVPLLKDAQPPRPIALGAYAFATRADRWHSPAVASFRRWIRNETAGGHWNAPKLASA
jgi:LysR family transcriptional regulator, glycine cleavage system transcriptional activator